MEKVTTIAEVRLRVAAWRRAGQRVAFVPTMGNLHAGHLALIDTARSLADRVVVSIFVNPLQFGENEDLAAYPRTPREDAERLQAHGADLLFSPSEAEMYPLGREAVTWVEVPGLSEILCGASRPGHFRGVATVVCKLFNIVQPEVAIFGEKDYQQLMVLRRMAADLCLPIELVSTPTVREADGLAMSSRNAYLSPQERAVAPKLYATLCQAGERLSAGQGNYTELERAATEWLADAGFTPDYVSIRRAEDLELPAAEERRLVVLAAARLGKTRLIDNILIIR